MMLPNITFLSCMVARRARWFAAGRPAVADRPAASFIAMLSGKGFAAGMAGAEMLEIGAKAALIKPQRHQSHAGEMGNG